MSEKEFKKKELERLLAEEKISIDQYLDTRAKLEHASAAAKPLRKRPTKPAEVVLKAEKPKRSLAKLAIGLVICTVILIAMSSSWLLKGPADAEQLAIESYDLSSFPAQGKLAFQLTNIGSIPLNITRVTFNGFSNQSYLGLLGSNTGWNGATSLNPGGNGTIYVNLMCYINAFIDALPSGEFPQTEAEAYDALSKISNNDWLFTFTTSTNREYSIEVPDLLTSLTTSMGTPTIGFMGTSLVTVTNVGFAPSDAIFLSLKNTGTKTVTITTVKINNQIAQVTSAFPVTITPGSIASLSIAEAWMDGNTYKIDLYDSSNQIAGSIQQNAPGA